MPDDKADNDTLPDEGVIGDDDDSDYSDDFEDDEEFLSPEEREELERQREAKREEQRKMLEEEEAQRRAEDEVVEEEDLWNFPVDRENWTEDDLGEHWEDFWGDTNAVGWDPELVSKGNLEKYRALWEQGTGPPQTPYYVPYRKFYPPIPNNHYDIQTPEDVVEELERMEEFLVWVSYVFKDGSSYEGTVWDDLAHGKGVYTTPLELCRYEGEWFQNMMEGHGVLEVTLPVTEPVPDTPEYFRAKKEGQIMRSDYMNSFDREWLKMDAEDLFQKHGGVFKSFEERKGWIDLYGELPEKGNYKYSGQWKHSRFHGCGVYEVNGRPIWGKFYFGELLPDPEECTAENSAIHSSLAEVAAAKARMFVNKPDGMVREIMGPYSDPSHPYMYEEEDLWMAPGFINAYYEVPKEWKQYVEDLDQEREMWLNSFYKTPFIIPMQPELEYWWSQNDEFVLLGNTPSSLGPANFENLERAEEDLEGEVLLHVPTGRIINWTEDKDGKLRFFYQPITEDGEVIPEAAIPLPLGFDEYMKDDTESGKSMEKKNFFRRFREAWEKTKDEYEEDRKKSREELERKWKQEDEVAEIRRKLKRAERYLAFQIEEEKLLAKQRASQSTSVDEEEVADQEEQTSKEEDGQETGSMEQEGEGGADEESKGEQDDEENKKPKSFGKVALVEIEESVQPSSGSNERGSSFPTTFASLSLGSKAVLNEVNNSRFGQMLFGFLSKGPHNVGDAKTQLANLDGKIKVQPLGQRYQLILSASRASRKSSIAVLPKSPRRPYDKHRFRKSVTNQCSSSRCQVCNLHGLWSRPEFDFLSLALPVKQYLQSPTSQ